MAMELATQSSKSKKGGILLGLGLVKERKGSPKDALPFLEQALKMYQVSVCVCVCVYVCSVCVCVCVCVCVDIYAHVYGMYICV
jgi:hypothetical protein